MSNILSLDQDHRPCDTEPISVPNWCSHWNIYHLSPSTLKSPIAKWVLDKILFDLEDIKLKKHGVPARLGSACNQLIDLVDGQGFDFNKILKEILADLKYRHQGYEPIDFFKLEQYQTILLDVYENIQNAFSYLGVNLKKCDTETPIELYLKNLEIPINGFTDFRTQTQVLELKTKWNRVSKIKEKWTVNWILKNGEVSKQKKNFESESLADEFIQSKGDECIKNHVEEHYKMSTAPIVKEPYPNDIMQVALYSKATGLKPVLIYATNSDFYTFDESNCELMTQPYLDQSVENARRLAIVRQNLLKKTTTTNELISLIEPPEWDSFFYDWGDEIQTKARKLWKI